MKTLIPVIVCNAYNKNVLKSLKSNIFELLKFTIENKRKERSQIVVIYKHIRIVFLKKYIVSCYYCTYWMDCCIFDQCSTFLPSYLFKHKPLHSLYNNDQIFGQIIISICFIIFIYISLIMK